MTERRFDHIEGRLGNLESGMVTKDYLLVSNF